MNRGNGATSNVVWYCTWAGNGPIHSTYVGYGSTYTQDYPSTYVDAEEFVPQYLRKRASSMLYRTWDTGGPKDSDE